jgi:hypothetical protein
MNQNQNPPTLLQNQDEQDLLDFLKSGDVSAPPLSKAVDEPIAITPEVKEKMLNIMGQYEHEKDRLAQINKYKKKTQDGMNELSNQLTTLMKLYGLKELIRGHHRFVLEEVSRKKPLRKEDFKKALTMVITDDAQVAKVYSQAESLVETVKSEKLKYLKYKGS